MTTTLIPRAVPRSVPRSVPAPRHVRPVRPITVTLETVERHTRYGRRYRVGERYALPLRLAGASIEAGVVRPIGEGTHDWYGAPGRVLQAEPGPARVQATTPTPGALRILQGCGYDPGSAAYRFHSALNETTRHASAFVRWQDANPHSSLRQLDLARDWPAVRHAVETADVLHCHVDYALFEQAGYTVRRRPGQVIVRHYHGSRPDGRSHPQMGAADDDRVDAVVVGARLSLVAERPDRVHWLPIAVPVARYRAMRVTARLPGAPFRIAHSPTRRELKGTRAFLAVCERLRAQGLAVQPVLIEGRSHGEALRVKATCDAVFDSFWLGLQGSGLEGAAMGLPVLAGDPDVRALYARETGACPYTFAPTEAALGEAIERLATDPAYREAEAARVGRYVADVHDYAAVARRYEAILSPSLSTLRGAA